MKNIPNKLTTLRLILIPFFITFVFLENTVLGGFNNYIACGIFILASVTDFFDGFLARKWNQVTDFGKLFDPAADKLLCCSALILLIFMMQGLVEMYFLIILTIFVIVIICRELFITAFRSMATQKGIVMQADMPGKIKTFAQMLAIMILVIVPDVMLIAHTAGNVVFYIGFGILAFGTLMAVFSCFLYLKKYSSVFKTQEKKNETNQGNFQ